MSSLIAILLIFTVLIFSIVSREYIPEIRRISPDSKKRRYVLLYKVFRVIVIIVLLVAVVIEYNIL